MKDSAIFHSPDASITVGESQFRWNAAYNPPRLEQLRTELIYHMHKIVDQKHEWVPVPTVGLDSVDRGLSNDIDNLRETLNLFREFVIKNATQWKCGAGVHHHPMWAKVAEALGEEVPDIKSGAEWMFIQPENRATLEEIRSADRDDSS